MPSLLCPPPPSILTCPSISHLQSVSLNTPPVEEQNYHTYGRHPGNLTPLATMALSCSCNTKTIGTVQVGSLGRICRLPIRYDALVSGWVVERCGFGVRRGGRVFCLVEGGVRVQVESSGLVGEHGRMFGGAEGLELIEKNRNLARRRVENVSSIEEKKLFSCQQGEKDSIFVERNGRKGGVDFSEENDGTPMEKRHKVVEFVHEQSGSLGVGKNKGQLVAVHLINEVRTFLAAKNIKIPNFNEGKQLAISDFNVLLIVLVKAEELDLAINVFYEVASFGLSPDSLSFSIIIQCLCKRKEPDNAKLVLHEMLTNGFHPNVVTFTVLINCFCKKGKLQKAMEVFEIMGEVGCEPSIQTYNCLLNGLCYVGRIEEACRLLRKIEKSSKKPDIYTYTTIMDGFCKVGRSDEAMELLDEALKIGLKPTIVTFNALLNGYCKEGRPVEGVCLLKEMKVRDCHPDVISYTILLQGLLRWGKAHAALSVYKEMVGLGLQVDERVMNTLLRGICRESITNGEQLGEAEEIFQRIVEMGYHVSPYTYCLMVQALANRREISKAFTNLLEMVRMGYSPRMMTYNVVIRVLCEEGRTDDAFLLLILMIKSGTIPSTFSCTVLVDECNQHGRILDACGIYGVALKQGVVVRRKPKRKL